MFINQFSNNFEALPANPRIKNLLSKLRKTINDFKVENKQGHLIGKVRDLIIDNKRQINLVVEQKTTEETYQLFLLNKKSLQEINPIKRTIVVDIDQIEIQYLSEYITTEMSIMEGAKMPNNIPSTSTNIEDLDEERSLEVLEEEIIRLMGERLIVDRTKRKVGEVIVRKEIETVMVQVPVRRERLIVEQVSPEKKQLANINLGQEEFDGIELNESPIQQLGIARGDRGIVASGEFDSPKIASLLLNAIAMERNHGCKKIRIEIIVEDSDRQQTYQEWFDRCSEQQPIAPE